MNLPVLSHTFLSNYANCPRKAWHLYIAQDLPREPKTPEMRYGIDVHEAFERACKSGSFTGGNLAFTPEHETMVHTVRDVPGIKHYEWPVAIARSGTPVGFWTEMAWLRGKLDVAIVAPPIAMIIDWKTGKPREDPAELEVFNLLLRCTYPHVDAVTGLYVWLKTGQLGQTHRLGDPAEEFERIKGVEDELKGRPIDKEWPPTPNPLCAWCAVRKCEYWREKR